MATATIATGAAASLLEPLSNWRPYPLVHRFLVPLELRLRRTHEVRYELDGFAPVD